LFFFFDNLKDLPLEEKKEKGKEANEIRQFLKTIYTQKNRN